MVAICQGHGQTVPRALLTAMDQPLGRAVGNAVEVVESIEALKVAVRPISWRSRSRFGVQMLLLGKAATRPSEARVRLENANCRQAPRWRDSATPRVTRPGRGCRA